MKSLKQDLYYAWRALLQMPGLNAVILLSIALGIAAVTTVFSVANGLLWAVLPVRDPGRLVMFSEGNSFSYPDYLDLRDQTADLFDNGIAAHDPLIPASVGGGGSPERVWGQAVSGNYFAMLKLRMAAGRSILAREDAAQGNAAVVVLGHSLWARRFGSDPNIVNHEVALNGKTYTVVGVAPRGFEGTERGIVAEYWVPLAMIRVIQPDLAATGVDISKREDSWLMLDARLKPGVSRARAESAVAVIKKRLDEKYRPSEKHHETVTLQTAGNLVAGSHTPATLLIAVLMAIVAALLLVVCANVGNLLLARASGRQKEIAVRMALGATRGRLVRQLLTESALLATFGAVFGLLLAGVAARALSGFQLPIPLPIKFDFNVDMRVLAFTALLTPLTALLFGLAPALRATRPDIAAVLKSGPGDGKRGRRFGMRNTLVVVQVAVSVVLLATAGLFMRSLSHAASIDIGFKPDHILISAIDPRIHGYSDAQTAEFLKQLRERVEAIHGVTSVAYTDLVPLSIAQTNNEFSADAPGTGPAQTTSASVFTVSDGFFQTMGIEMRRGNEFQSHPDPNSVILNEHLAARLFPLQDPIGRTVSQGTKKYTVIGVAEDSKARSIGEAPADCVYMRLAGGSSGASSFFGISMLVKTAAEPRRFEQPVRAAIAGLDARMAVFNTETMEEHVSKSLMLPRISSLLFGLFSAIGLSLAAIGLYAVMSYWVRGRVHEIGIRMALGASARSVLKMVFRQGLTMTGIGLAIGIGLALLLGRFTANLLYGVKGTDLVTCASVCAVLLAAATIAMIVPAMRAARIQPSTALRQD
ncbi:MAG TPA: ABC transporter permease [Terracidiphilus sp.]|jgi:predicted permease